MSATEVYTPTRMLALQTALLDKINDKLKRIDAYLAEANYYQNLPLGTTYSMRLHPPANGPMIKLDFVKGENQHIPAGDSVPFPACPVSTVIVYNEGSTQVGFSTNKPVNSTDADVLVKAGETFTINGGRPSINRLHLVAPFADGDVRILLIV